jgi:ammonia channel protein AmtB
MHETMDRKLIKKIVLISILWIILCYSIFSFLVWNPDPEGWSFFGRLLFIIFAFVLTAILIAVFIDSETEKRKKNGSLAKDRNES